MILCIELMFFSISLNFLFFSVYTYNAIGQILALLIITTAAAETAVGLSLVIVSYRLSNKLSYNNLISLRG
jgi:NADH-quinone oxidoreductase subunit K